MRTSMLMNSGFVIGTGDVSEAALGWCTYNGDHMSMYNPNSSIPKTLVKFLVEWAARNEFDGEARRHAARRGRYAHFAGTAAARRRRRDRAVHRVLHRPLRVARLLPVPLPPLRRPAGEDPFPRQPRPLRPPLRARTKSAAGWASSCAASSPTSSSAPACPTAPRSARSACRRAATGACRATPRPPCGCAASRTSRPRRPGHNVIVSL